MRFPNDPRFTAACAGLALASTAWVGVLLATAPKARERTNDVAADVERELVREGQGIWDGHADPDVGRVLQAGLEERAVGRITVSSNTYGEREREWVRPKPPGRVRIVLLGDSYVFGNGVAAEERAGVVLEAELRRRAGIDAEVLHLGMTDWNLVASANYLRRRLHAVDPDLVVHVLIYNDLDDPAAVRGFGGTASWSAQVRRHADGLVYTRQPYLLGFGGPAAEQSLLNAAIDGESRARYSEARHALVRLRAELDARGARYLAVLHWPDHTAVAHRELLAALPYDDRAFVPATVFADPDLRVGPLDSHWNARGHTAVAEMLYGLIAERGLLPSVRVPDWPEAARRAAEWTAAGRAEAQVAFDLAAFRGGVELSSALVFARLDAVTATQVHGGIDRSGAASPYASFVLARPGARRLALDVEPPSEGAPRGVARVAIDGREVGEFPLGAAGRHTFDVPVDARDRSAVAVTITSDDWIHSGPRLARCVAFRLVGAALDAGDQRP